MGTMNIFKKILFILLYLLFLLFGPALFAQSPDPRQSQEAIRDTVEQFLQTQTTGLPGQVGIVIGSIDSRLNLPACNALQPFLPNGSRAWGKTTIGVRCTTPSSWTIYVTATVRVQADYLIAAVPLTQGQIIGPNDIARTKGDLTSLPAGVLTDSSQALGRTTINSFAVGTALRHDALRNPLAVQQGQNVRLISIGPGFRISTEARALANASEGQMVQVRTPGGQVVSGIAKAGSIVEVNY
jgi:flagellar basal body P-ring formation protein FlgA